MPSVDRLPMQEYPRSRLNELRRDILRYARTFPSGGERNQHRHFALSLARLFKNRHWLAANPSGG
jgi:hypothetical protein